MKVRVSQQGVVVEHLSGCSASDDVAVGHHADAVRDFGGEFEVVRRQDDTDTVLVNLLDPLRDQLGPVGIKPCERFVEHDHTRFEDEHTGEASEPFLPAA
ncbi:hypothetical protein C463_00205, partial [Halorubrum californiense DSM 19288]